MLVSEEYVNYVKNTYNKGYTVEMAACALIEETVEFDADMTTDEFGDILYQLILFGIVLNLQIDAIHYQEDVEHKLFSYVVKITSQYKKRLTRNMPLDNKLIRDYYEKIYSLIINIATYYKLNIHEVEQENIKKLDKRYDKDNCRKI